MRKKSPIKTAANALSGSGLKSRVDRGVARALGTGTGAKPSKPAAKPVAKAKPKPIVKSKAMQTAAAKAAAERKAATARDSALVAKKLAARKKKK